MFATSFSISLLFILSEILLSLYLILCIFYFVVSSNLKTYNYPQLVKSSTSLSIFVFTMLLLYCNYSSFSFQIFNGIINTNILVWFFQILLLLSAIGTAIFFKEFYAIRGILFYEYDFLIGFALLGLFILSSSNDFSILYLAIELQSLSLYVLAIFYRSSEFSNEAGVKYFILGSFSSCILLLGISLIYLSFGVLDFTSLAKIIAYTTNLVDISFFALLLLFSSLLFKLGVVPFHMWLLDVYEGCLIVVTAFFSTVPKSILVLILLKIVMYTFTSLSDLFLLLFGFVGSLSIVFASVAALYQRKVKRLIGYSSISHIGFIIIALSCCSLESVKSLIIYINLYTFAGLALFGIFINSTSNGALLKYLINWSFLAKWNGVLAITFSLLLFNLAGIPPFSGFYAKMEILLSLISINNIIWPLIIVVFSCLGCFYYIRLIKILYFVKQIRNTFINFTASRLIDFTFIFFVLILFLFLLKPNLIINIATVLSFCVFDSV